ncbi:MAG: hypothetical protein RIR04_1927 [Pseudomonadota bacterium]
MPPDFFDNNIVLYLLDEGPKAETAKDLIAKRGMISVQALNEALVKCLRKAGMSWDEAGKFLHGIRQFCVVKDLTPATHDIGRAIGARYGFSVYDAMIVAAALEAGCTKLYSEHIKEGLFVEGKIRIVNPFRR